MHVPSYGGSDAAQEGDEVDGEYSAEQMDEAQAEVHGLIGRVAHEAQPPRNADEAHRGDGVHGELDVDGTGRRRRAVAQRLLGTLVEDRHGQGIHERGQIEQQNRTDERPDRCGAVEAMLVADGLAKRNYGEGDAHQIGQPDKRGPPLLQVRNDVGDVIVHAVTCP